MESKVEAALHAAEHGVAVVIANGQSAQQVNEQGFRIQPFFDY